jgi:hypothetical protein
MRAAMSKRSTELHVRPDPDGYALIGEGPVVAPINEFLGYLARSQLLAPHGPRLRV